jgi:succinoglycan biosynthesis transport protein ExoP
VSLLQFLFILRVRYKAFLLGFFVIAALVALTSLRIPSYKAESVVVVDATLPDPVAGFVLAANGPGTYLPTQADIAASDYVAQKVVKALRMDQDPALTELWTEHTNAQGDKVAWLANVLQQHLSVSLGKESSTITIGFRSDNPRLAAQIANAFAAAYVDTNIELRAKPAQDSATWLRGQVQTSQNRLDQIQTRVADYRRTHAFVESVDHIDVETNKLADLMQQLTLIQGQLYAANSKRQLAGDSLQLPEVADDPVIAKLRSDIGDARARVAEASVDLGVNHPTYLQARSHLDALEAQLAHEQQVSMSGFSRSQSIDTAQEADLKTAIAAQRARVLEINQERNELNVLEQEQQAAESAYQEVSRRYTQATLQSGSVQTNAVVLSTATQPTVPSPGPVIYAALALVLGTAFGALAAFYREITDRRVRFSRDIELTADLPLLADFCVPERRTWRRVISIPKLLK